ncbi:bifunctional transaldolase/phosoglucose isomerase [[Eubacterium] cellulosolvens]
MNPLRELQKYGQSFWLDYIRRSLITSGELQRLVEEDGLRGVTSNPTIFQKAIAGSSDYDKAITEILKKDPHIEVQDLFETLAIEDIQMATDILRPVYDETGGADGFVSLELPPDLAHDTFKTIDEARRLWKKINRPNLMLKVPATSEGIPVIETLIAEGINVNITLMFSLSHYEDVANAYIRGIENCREPGKVSSVASFFVSRIDSIVDKDLDNIGTSEALALKGRIAIANAKTTYKRFQEIFSSKRWERLAKHGARLQRPLWASTSTKNPSYSDVLYIEELIGSDTVNTIPPATLNAFRDHGLIKSRLDSGFEEAETQLNQLKKLGIDFNEITEKLQYDGVKAFSKSYNELLSTLEEKRQAIIQGQKAIRTYTLGKYQEKVKNRLNLWRDIDFNRRLWSKDPTLWFEKPVPEITDRLGWLTLPEMMRDQVEDLFSFAEEIKSEGMRNVVLLGMGGSSLAPDVFQNVYGNKNGYPQLIVLDSSHPSNIKSVEDKIDLSKTLFLVSSKSGTTIETLSLFKYFWKKIQTINKNSGQHFVAITDYGSPLMKLAEDRDFRRIFTAPSDIGGRYSALTVFGLVPAALIGLDIHQLLDQAWMMSESCAFCILPDETPGLELGATLGELTKAGRDKVTFLTSPSISRFPIWLEQLVAESTGKDGKGIIPVTDEPAFGSEFYEKDRLFVFLFMEKDDNQELEKSYRDISYAGHPIVRINLTEKMNLGQEIFCWEKAIAAAGAILGIHPFNQPNVELAKQLARQEMEKSKDKKQFKEDIETYSIENLKKLRESFKKWVGQAQIGDYVTIQAFLQYDQEITEVLQKIRLQLTKRFRLATTSGFGPRFLHSTGQLHKGGPNTCLIFQLIDEPAEQLEIPETEYTFNSLIQAQALGDYNALKQLNRRVLRINLKKDPIKGLSEILELIR